MPPTFIGVYVLGGISFPAPSFCNTNFFNKYFHPHHLSFAVTLTLVLKTDNEGNIIPPKTYTPINVGGIAR